MPGNKSLTVDGKAKRDSIEDEEASRKRKPKMKVARNSMFHNPQAMIAFAPSSTPLPKEIEDIANLPASNIAGRAGRRSDPTSERWRIHHHLPLDSSLEAGNMPKKLNMMEKIPLPRPYRKQWENLEGRRAERSFIYGRDEENEFAERDRRVKTPCCGVICFHALELLDLVVNKKSFSESVPISYFCLLIIGSIKRCTKIVHAWDPRQIKMDYFVHLSVDVSEWREAPNNKLRIELWSFQDPEAHYIVGHVEIHIYNFIRLQHTIDTVTLWSDSIKVGMLAYEVAFSYGAFGYGHSNQLKNFSQPIMETISHSMFPRIKLDSKKDNFDSGFQARLPEELKMFTYHSLVLEVDEMKNPSAFFGRQSKAKRYNRIDLEPKPMVVQQVEFDQGFPVHCKLHMNIWQKALQPDFNDMYGEFVCIGHKRGRLDYLTNMVQGRMRDLYEEEASPLFQHLRQKDLDVINLADYNPAQLIHPSSVPCPSSEPYTIGLGDEFFQDKFPRVRRESGYLAKLFGFGEGEGDEEGGDGGDPPPPSVPPNDDDMKYLKTYSVRLPPSSKEGGKKPCNMQDWLWEVLTCIKVWFIRAFLFVFPEVHEKLEIPEISLTVASPEGSTTNIYAYFAREVKDNSANSKVARIVRQTTQLLDQTTRKSQTFSDDSSSSSEEDQEAKKKS